MLEAHIESILFISAKPISVKKLAEFLKVDKKSVEAAVETLVRKYDTDASGMRLVRSGSEVQMMTSPDCTKPVREFVKDEVSGELTRPQLETLTVIAYRQPITKAELEQIRGINCSLILRNLAMRGLIETEEGKDAFGPSYRVSHECMKFLGVSDVSQLPDYERLHADEKIEAVLEHGKSEVRNTKSETSANNKNAKDQNTF